MHVDRRALVGAGAALALAAGAGLSPARADDAADVKAAVEELRQAMLTADKAKLEAVTADALSYGHSANKIETKAIFVEVVASKKTVYKALDWTVNSVGISGDAAVVRHAWKGHSVTDGKDSHTDLQVVQVWQKQGGKWRLLARQAFKPVT